MKKIIILPILLVFILLLGAGCISNSIKTTITHPTQEEWLEVYITHGITEVTDLWEQRIAIRTGIFKQDKEIVITLSSANGQSPLGASQKTSYEKSVKSIVQEIIKNYDWVKNYKIIVQFI